MKRFWMVSAILVAVGLLLALTTPAGKTGADALYLGMPVICWGNKAAPCWLAMGGEGVLVFGFGAGIVEYGFVGAGVLFACGQAAVGLIAFGQAALGLVFVCSQLGGGLTGLGQLVFGGWAIGQARVAADGRDFLKQLNADLDELLRFKLRRGHSPWAD